jgi:hypothetical protein
MAGGTHVFDMIKRLKENENLKKNSYFKTRHIYTQSSGSPNLVDRSGTKEERQKIRNRIIQQERHAAKSQLLILLFSVIVVFALAFIFFNFVEF